MRSRKRHGGRTPARRPQVSEAFRAFVVDQLDELGDVTARAMFGGYGLYHRGVFFGIIARDVLYLKGIEGTEPFRPYPDRPGTMKYYAVPVDVLESAFELAAWARRAIAVAQRTSRT